MAENWNKADVMIDPEIYAGLNSHDRNKLLRNMRNTQFEIAQEIFKKVCKQFSIDHHYALKQVRKRELVQVRQVAAYFIKKNTTLSLKDIAKTLGYTNHSTIIYAIQTVEDMMETDKKFNAVIGKIKELLEDLI